MTTTYPGTLDSYATKVDGVDDVLAAHINDPQDAIEALEAQHQLRSLLRVKNEAGATVAANDLGYINEAGSFVRTTTANLAVAWATVIVGGANNAQIIVCRRGRVTITLNANCSIGDFLATSTTAGQASVLTAMRPEVCAVALTANASGAGGTCEAQLLTGTVYVGLSSAIDVYFVHTADETDWRTTINGAPAGAVVTYTAPLTSGAENTIVPTAATQYGKLRMYNETRSNYALVDSVNIGANTFTVTLAADIADWVNTDVITARSQTVVNPTAPPYFWDIDLSSADNDTIPITARALEIETAARDTGAAREVLYLHSWETYGAALVKQTPCYTANLWTFKSTTVPLIQRRFNYMLFASGAGTCSGALRLSGWWEAVP